MTKDLADLNLSLEQLTGTAARTPSSELTPLVEDIENSWKKPLNQLSADEIGDLVIQHVGYPYLLDLILPKLEEDPLFDGGNYPGDILSNLLRADQNIWNDRPDYRARLKQLYARALERPDHETDGLRISLNLPESSSRH